MFTSKSYISENFDCDTINTKENFSIVSRSKCYRCIFLKLSPKINLEVIQFILYFRIVLIEHTLRMLTLVWSMNMDHLHNILFATLNGH